MMHPNVEATSRVVFVRPDDTKGSNACLTNRSVLHGSRVQATEASHRKH